MIWMVNVTVATVGQNALNSLTSAAGGISLEIGKLTGAQIMAFPFQHPETLGSAMPFHSNFIKPALGELTGSARYANGGILALLFAAAGWFLLMLLCAARLFVLCVGTIFAPVYISMSMLSNRVEPAVGWLMLMVRSVFVQLLWVFVWASMIWINVSYAKANLSDTLGFVAAGANSIMLFIIAYLTYRFWFKPSVGQIIQPATLAGALVIENVGKATAAVGKLVEAVGMITLQPEIVGVGAGIKTGGDKLKTTGEALKEASKQAPEKLSPGGAIDALHSRAQQRYEKHREEQKKKEQRRYWKYGEKFIIRDIETGLPVEVPAPPAGYEYAGMWPPA
ncbi:MAG: hypothetical protein K6U04_08585 [Armatimonadetes bacterium]|nr:hypothetical protein [Armatimonadota bacterium]